MNLYTDGEVKLKKQPNRQIRGKWQQLRENVGRGEEATESSFERVKMTGRGKVKDKQRDKQKI